jgi:integrase
MHQLSETYRQTLRTTRIIITKMQVDHTRSLAAPVNLAAAKAYIDGYLDPYSYHTILGLAPIYRVPAFFLAYFRCRWSEVVNMRALDVLDNTTLTIHQPKTGADKYMPTRHIKRALEECRWNHAANIVVVSHPAMATRLQQQLHASGVMLPPGCKRSTHAFRHIYASWADAQGVPKETITQELGHTNPASLQSYIHPCSQIFPLMPD